jgi:hypothetical protein
MSKYMLLAVLLVMALTLTGACMASQDPAPAEPTGIELDIDRAKPRPPLKQTQPKFKKVSK